MTRTAGEPNAYEVPRLRIYPHALRTDNAYYSPDKMALLFGYFPATVDARATRRPRARWCSPAFERHHRSRDVACPARRPAPPLPGSLEPGRARPSTRPSPISSRCSSTSPSRNWCASRSPGARQAGAAELLGGLAQQFGEGTQRGGPLRDYLGPEIAKLDYATTNEVHARGSILVSAVYDAFLEIVDRRTRI